ncbi:MAG TPA: hypothetical protein VFI62_02410 [Burkholderiales bacterium]|nr:hypothetical protein [Burkholderiales bacterium]
MALRTLASDDFNRVDSTGLGANWGSVGSISFDVKTNQASNAATLNVQNHYTGVAFPNDQWAQATVKVKTSTSWIAVTARASGTVNTYYAGGCDPLDFGGSEARRIWKNVAGTRTSLATEAINVAVNDVLRLEVQGTTIKLFVNGVERLSAVDAAIASGSPGMLGRASAGTDVQQFDDFSAGDFV